MVGIFLTAVQQLNRSASYGEAGGSDLDSAAELGISEYHYTWHEISAGGRATLNPWLIHKSRPIWAMNTDGHCRDEFFCSGKKSSLECVWETGVGDSPIPSSRERQDGQHHEPGLVSVASGRRQI